MSEYWDLYNQSGALVSRKHERGTIIEHGLYHLVVSAWVLNHCGEFLMSRRCPKKSYPLLWECTGGSALTGETGLQAAVREVKEELGITLDPTNGHMVFRMVREASQDFYEVWLFSWLGPVPQLTLQESEVCEAAWLKMDSIYELQRNQLLHPLIDYLDRIRIELPQKE